jgi:hypothetical protein
MPRLIDSIKHGDRVTIRTPQGQERTGKAVMRSAHGGWVLNMGGKHGTPGIADDDNVTKVVPARKRKGLGFSWKKDKRPTFDTLPVGTCFAYEEKAKKATRRKVADRRAVALPHGKLPMHVGVDKQVKVLPCETALGRRRRR